MSSTHAATRYRARLQEVLGGADRGILRHTGVVRISKRISALGENVSPSTVRTLRLGYLGRIDTVRSLARAFAPELLREWGREIVRDTGGEATTEAAVNWLAWVAETDGGRIGSARPLAAVAGSDPAAAELKALLVEVLAEVRELRRELGELRAGRS